MSCAPDGPGLDRPVPGRPGTSRPGRVARALIWAVELYRHAVSPLRPPTCRYLPTCSAYAVEAITVHGVSRGCYLAARRLLRCHPFHAGGIDPVPARRPGAQHTPTIRSAA